MRLESKCAAALCAFKRNIYVLCNIPAPTQVNDEVKAALARSFDDGDRNVATHFAEIAYKEAMR